MNMTRAALFGSLLLLFLLCAPVCAGAAEYELNMTSAYLDSHPVTQKVFIPWIEEIKRKSNGRLQIAFFNMNSFFPDEDTLRATAKGFTDIGHNAASREPGKMTAHSVMDIAPLASADARSATRAYWELYNNSPELQAELRGIKVLALHLSNPVQVMLTQTSSPGFTGFNRLLHGKTILVTTGTNLLQAKFMGAQPRLVSPTDFNAQLAANKAGGFLLPVSDVPSLGLVQMVKSVIKTDLPPNAYWLGMNQDVYDSLPRDLKKIIDDASGLKLSLDISKVLDESDAPTLNMLKSAGASLIEPAARQKQHWRNTLQPEIYSDWLIEMEQAKYMHAGEIYEKLLALEAAY